MSATIFLDTETTGLSLDDDIWEIAAVRREPDGTETEHHQFVEHDRQKCARLPESFRLDHEKRYDDLAAISPKGAARWFAALTRDGPHIVGAVPNFDTERLAILCARFGLAARHHYHLIDVENLAVGWLMARADKAELRAVTEPGPVADELLAVAASWRQVATPPWDSDELSRACGVEPPGEGVRHTAMGDVRWGMALYDRIMGNGS